MAEELYRFGVSGLRREDKDNAVNEEMLIQKDTGQFLIKSMDGEIISADSLNRLSQHINDVRSRSEILGTTGVLNVMEFDDLELPNVVTENMNLLGSDTLLIDTKLNTKILFSSDHDYLDVSTLDAIISSNPTNVELVFDITNTVDNITVSVTLDQTVEKLNNTIIAPNKFSEFIGVPEDQYANFNVKLKSLSFKGNPVNASKKMKTILHSILVLIN